MTQPTWFFREFKPGDNVSDPDFARALFTRDESAAARSLVREAVQNSLDARSASASSVDVRFAIRTGAKAVSSGIAAAFFDGLWPHVTSVDSGVEDPPVPRDAIPYILIEDFGTRGLIGDPSAWDPFESQKNSFFLFFRALGRSGKEGEDRGRWGVGKFVFPMTSRGHALLALTIPENGSGPLVMGRAVLRTHRVGATSFHPDGHWGFRTDNGLVLPVADDRMIALLKRVFDFKRATETGLSVIVPWVQGPISADSLRMAAAGEYFLPILRGELRIEIDDNGNTDTIDADRLFAMAESMEPPLLRARVVLGLEAATWPLPKFVYVGVASAGAEYDWGTARLTSEQRETASGILERGDVVGLRVPTTVRRKGADPAETYFDIFVRQVPGLGRARPLIIREGIAVSEDKTPYLRDYVSLIIVDHASLATFVGDAETPAHNELQNDLVKSKYTLAKKLISFLRGAPLSIVREVEGGDQAADTSLLAEFFPRLEPAPIARKPKQKESNEGGGVTEVPVIPGRAPRFRIGKAANGFTVNGTGAMRPGARVTIQCAYDIRRGNPLRKYREMDFIIGRDVHLDASGLSIESADANRISAEVEDPLFHLSADGFDNNRNVFVRVTVDEPVADS